MALVRFDCAARSPAVLVTPRNVGMAMASRMAMINSTTISSIRVNPPSAALLAPHLSGALLAKPSQCCLEHEFSPPIGNGWRATEIDGPRPHLCTPIR